MELYINIKIRGLYEGSTYVQGQARGYGRISHSLPLPLVGHDFQGTTAVTQKMSKFQIQGCQMKDMDIRYFDTKNIARSQVFMDRVLLQTTYQNFKSLQMKYHKK